MTETGSACYSYGGVQREYWAEKIRNPKYEIRNKFKDRKKK